MSAGLPARRAALAALTDVEVNGAWSNLAVPAAIADLPDVKDRAFAAHLAYDALRWEGTLDWALSQVVTRPLGDTEPAVLRVLRLGALQILLTKVPVRAAVDTSVTLAREQVPGRRAKGAGGFVNGVLRGLARAQDDLPWPDPRRDPIARLTLDHGHPRWITSELHARFGADRAAAILDADNRPPGLTLRATVDREALLAELAAAGHEVRAGSLPEALRVPGADPRQLDSVQAGRAVPQDEASMHVVAACEVRPGDRVLDLCAGPGGKATALAGQVGPDGEVVALELHDHRARLIEDAASRQGVRVDVRVADASQPVADGPFDVVLLDAPCSGLGTGRRRPEVRWRRRAEDVTELAAIQRRLLDAAVTALAPGGRLVYAVCTWTAEETERIAEHVDVAHARRLRAVSRRQLWPDTDDTDGMFIAVWERRPER